MTKINYRSDFDFILHLRTANGQEVGWPDYDWRARIFTSQKVNAVIISNIGGETTNCFNDNGSIHAVINNHRLTPGVLHIEFEALIPNGLYPDGDEKVVVPLDLGIELVRQASDCPSAIDVALIIPYIWASAYDLAVANGYKGTKDEYYKSLSKLPDTIQDMKDALDKIGEDGMAQGPVKVIDYDEETKTIYI